jgi:GT2 family glycosyltransferase
VPGVLVARRSAFDRIGLFDPDLDTTCDTDWLVRAQDAGLRHRVVPEVLLLWGLHGNNTSYRRADVKRDLMRTLHASIARKRAMGVTGDAL